MAGTVSLGRPLDRSIYSIFLLSVESNALELHKLLRCNNLPNDIWKLKFNREKCKVLQIESKNITIELKLSNKEIKKGNKYCYLRVGFDDTFKTDNHIFSTESRENRMTHWMVRSFISEKANVVLKYIKPCDTMWSFVVLGVCVYAGQRISLSDSAQKPHKGLRTKSPARPEMEEGRKVPEKTESQLTMVSRRDQSAWDSSLGEGWSTEGDSDRRQSKMCKHS